jgi:hypothetical protein
MKSNNYAAVVKQENHWWIAWIDDVPKWTSIIQGSTNRG